MGKNWRYIIRIVGGRKFLAFLIASIFCATKIVDQQIWLYAMLIYAGSNVASELVSRINIK